MKTSPDRLQTSRWSPLPVKFCSKAKYAPSGEKPMKASSSLGFTPRPGTAPNVDTTRSPPPLKRWTLTAVASEVTYTRVLLWSGLHECRPSKKPPPVQLAASALVPVNISRVAITLDPGVPGLPWVADIDIICWLTSCGVREPVIEQVVCARAGLQTPLRVWAGWAEGLPGGGDRWECPGSFFRVVLPPLDGCGPR